MQQAAAAEDDASAVDNELPEDGVAGDPADEEPADDENQGGDGPPDGMAAEEEPDAMAMAALAALGRGNVKDILDTPGHKVMAKCGFAVGSECLNLHQLQIGKIVLGACKFRVEGVDPASSKKFVKEIRGLEELNDFAVEKKIPFILWPLYEQLPNGPYRLHSANLCGLTDPSGNSLGMMVQIGGDGFNIHGPHGRNYKNFEEACAETEGACITRVTHPTIVSRMIAGREQGCVPGTLFKSTVSADGPRNKYTLPPFGNDNTVWEGSREEMINKANLFIADNTLWEFNSTMKASLCDLTDMEAKVVIPMITDVINTWSIDPNNNVVPFGSNNRIFTSKGRLRDLGLLKKLALSHFIRQHERTLPLIASKFNITEELNTLLDALPFDDLGEPKE